MSNCPLYNALCNTRCNMETLESAAETCRHLPQNRDHAPPVQQSIPWRVHIRVGIKGREEVFDTEADMVVIGRKGFTRVYRDGREIAIYTQPATTQVVGVDRVMK